MNWALVLENNFFKVDVLFAGVDQIYFFELCPCEFPLLCDAHTVLEPHRGTAAFFSILLLLANRLKKNAQVTRDTTNDVDRRMIFFSL